MAVAMPADRGVSYLIPTAEIVPIETDDAEVSSKVGTWGADMSKRVATGCQRV